MESTMQIVEDNRTYFPACKEESEFVHALPSITSGKRKKRSTKNTSFCVIRRSEGIIFGEIYKVQENLLRYIYLLV